MTHDQMTAQLSLHGWALYRYVAYTDRLWVYVVCDAGSFMGAWNLFGGGEPTYRPLIESAAWVPERHPREQGERLEWDVLPDKALRTIHDAVLNSVILPK